MIVRTCVCVYVRACGANEYLYSSHRNVVMVVVVVVCSSSIVGGADEFDRWVDRYITGKHRNCCVLSNANGGLVKERERETANTWTIAGAFDGERDTLMHAGRG